VTNQRTLRRGPAASTCSRRVVSDNLGRTAAPALFEIIPDICASTRGHCGDRLSVEFAVVVAAVVVVVAIRMAVRHLDRSRGRCPRPSLVPLCRRCRADWIVATIPPICKVL
jgi:hypothetical protein